MVASHPYSRPRTHCSWTFWPGILLLTFIFLLLCLISFRSHTEAFLNCLSPGCKSCSASQPATYRSSSFWFDKWFANYGEQSHGVDKYTGYFHAYDRHFHLFRGQSLTLLEIGVQSGGSISMWQDYFGPGLVYYGLDINRNCQQFSRDNVTIFIGDQGNKEEMKNLIKTWPNFDIVIDDGGHTMQQQMVSFDVLFPRLKTGGVYLIEDLHSSYLRNYGGSSSRESMSMVERAKIWIDVLNLQWTRNEDFKNNSYNVDLHNVMDSLHFYDSMVFVLKENVTKNSNIRRGGKWIPCPACVPHS